MENWWENDAPAAEPPATSTQDEWWAQDQEAGRQQRAPNPSMRRAQRIEEMDAPEPAPPEDPAATDARLSGMIDAIEPPAPAPVALDRTRYEAGVQALGRVPTPADLLQARGAEQTQQIEAIDPAAQSNAGLTYDNASLTQRASDQLRSGVEGIRQMPYALALPPAITMLQNLDAADSAGAPTPDLSPTQQRLAARTPEQRAALRRQAIEGIRETMVPILESRARQGQMLRNPRAQAIVEAGNAGRWDEVWSILRDDPAGLIQQFTLESLPQSALMMAPGVGLGLAGAGRVAQGVATYLSSYGTEFAGNLPEALTDALKAQGVNVDDAAAVSQAMAANPGAMEAGVREAGRGANGPAIFDAITLGFARGIRPGSGIAGNAGRVAANFGIELAGEPAGAALGQVFARGSVDKPGDLIAETLGAVGQTAPTTVAGTINEAREARAARPSSGDSFIDSLRARVPVPAAPESPPGLVPSAAMPAAPAATTTPPADTPPAVDGSAAGAPVPPSAPAAGPTTPVAGTAAPPSSVSGQPSSAAAPGATPPAVLPTAPPNASPARLSLEAALGLPTGSTPAQAAQAWQAQMPQGFTVVEEGGVFSVLSPDGEAIAQTEQPTPEAIAASVADAQALQAQGIYGEAAPPAPSPQPEAPIPVNTPLSPESRPAPPPAPAAQDGAWWDSATPQERRRLMTAAGVRKPPAAAWASFSDETRAALTETRDRAPPAPPAAPQAEAGQPSELIQAMNLLAELNAEVEAQGQVVDARLLDRVRQARERLDRILREQQDEAQQPQQDDTARADREKAYRALINDAQREKLIVGTQAAATRATLAKLIERGGPTEEDIATARGNVENLRRDKEREAKQRQEERAQKEAEQAAADAPIPTANTRRAAVQALAKGDAVEIPGRGLYRLREMRGGWVYSSKATGEVVAFTSGPAGASPPWTRAEAVNRALDWAFPVPDAETPEVGQEPPESDEAPAAATPEAPTVRENPDKTPPAPADDIDQMFEDMADEEDAKAAPPKQEERPVLIIKSLVTGKETRLPVPPPPTAKPAAPAPRPAPQVAADAGKKAASGVSEAAAALEALMMGKGGKLYSGLPIFDPDTYKAVLPQLLKAVRDFRDAWGDLKELMRRAYQGLVAAVSAARREQFREWIKPYITQFARDVRAGDVRLEEADDGLEGGSPNDAGAGEPGPAGGTEEERDAAGDAGAAGSGSGRPVRGDGGADAEGAPGDEADVSGADEGGSPGDRGSEAGGDGDADSAPGPALEPGTATEAAQAATPDQTGKNYVITPADKIGEGTERQKARDNVEAIRLLKQIEAEGRPATTEEKTVLVRYVGWGGLKRAFKPAGAPQWMQQINRDLRDLLTPAEYDLAEGSVLNAHYTSPEVIASMWDAVRHMGFTGGRVLEPSAGVGHFLGLAPQDFRKPLRWTAGELDSVTGRILGLLYPEAAVNVGPFETARLPDGFYDLAISNVPFGDYPANDPSPRYARARRSIHDYFFARSLDLVRPGGVVAFITSRFTLDKILSGSRDLYAEKGAFLGAIRLPDTAFKGNAGTEVVTDVIFMRRLMPDEKPDTAAEWLRTTEIRTPEGPATINAWLAARPEMMLGEMRLTGTMYGPAQPTLKPREGSTLAEQMVPAIQALPTDAFRAPAPTAPAPASATFEAAVGERDGAYGIDAKGAVYAVVNGRRSPVTGREASLARKYMTVRDSLRGLIAAEMRGGDDAALAPLRKALNDGYDAFVAAHGPLNSTVVRKSPNGKPYKSMTNLRPLASDPDIWRVSAIEDYDFETGKATKRAVFRERILAPAQRIDVANTPSDAIALSLDKMGRFDLAFASQALGMGEADAIEAFGDLIFQNPAGEQWETAVEYLSGDVRKKLAQAEAAAKLDDGYRRNVEALRPRIPPTLTASADSLANEIQAPFGAPWIPPSIYKAFLSHLANREVPPGSRIAWSRAGAGWIVDLTFSEGAIPALERWSTGRVSFKFMLQQTLNNGRVVVKDKIPDGKGGQMEVVNQKETEAAQGVQRNLRAEFENWVYLDEKRRSSLQDLYNEKYNNLAPRDWRSQADILSFPGIATRIVRGNETLPFALRPHQKAAIWRIVASGNTLLGHAVGAGKTFTMIGAGMEMKRLGLVRKPLYVVPNHMLGQFRREFYELYPGADLLIATKDDVSKRGRQAFIGRASSGNPDAIIMTHSSFTRLPMRPGAYADFIREEMDASREALEEAEKEEGKGSATVRLIRKRLKALEARLTKLLQSEKKDTGATFEETGIDFLFIDEAHEFKNLPISTKMGSVRGLSTTASGKAIDLLTKMRHLDKSAPNRAGVFATGTPVSNTMAEVYTMQRYLQPRVLEEQGIESFDAWAATFGEIVTSLEVRPSGNGFKESARFSRFRNAPELTAMFSAVSDVQTAEMLNLPRPELKGGKPRTIALEPTEWQQAKADELAYRYENLPKDPTIDNALKIVTEGRKAALDPRLLDEDAGADSGAKVPALAAEILRIYREGNAPLRAAPPMLGHGYFGVPIYGQPGGPVENHGKLQIVFLDLGTPNNRKRKAQAVIDGDATDITDDPIAVDVEEEAPEDDEAAAPDAEQVAAEQAEVEMNAAADDTGFNVYAAVTDRLVRGGIPRGEIAWIHDAKNDAQKDEMFTAAREGRIRVLMGSTAKMGVGTNVQRLAIALHHGDAPWRPSDVEQREGRVRRQGNLNPEVEIFRYVTKGTFDAYMWQTLEAKARFIGQFLAGTKGKRNVEDIDSPLPDAATVKAIATGDTRILEVAELTREITQLSAAREQHARTKEIARSVLRYSPPKIETLTEARDAMRADAEGLKAAKWTDAAGTTHAKAEDALKGIGGEIATKMSAAIMDLGARARFGSADPRVIPLPIKLGPFAVDVSAEASVTRWTIGVDANNKRLAVEAFMGAFQPRVVGRQTYLAGREFSATLRADTRELLGDGTLNPLQITARVDALARGIDGLVADHDRRIKALESDITSAEQEIERPFAKEEEYRTKLARLRALEAELSAVPEAAKPAAPAPKPPADGAIRVDLDGEDGGTPLYSTPFDPEAFQRLLWRPLTRTLGGKATLDRMAAALREENIRVVTRLWRGAPLPAGVTVTQEEKARDLSPFERYLKTPRALFRRFPALAALVDQGIAAEQRMSKWSQRLTEEFDRIRDGLSRAGGDWDSVQGALWMADAEGANIEDAALARELFEQIGLSPVEIRAAIRVNRLFVLQGRLVDQHNRDMQPKLKARKAIVWRRMKALLEAASVPGEDYAKLYRRRAYLTGRVREGKGDLAAHAAEIASINASLRGMRTADPDINARLAEYQTEYDTLEARLAKTSVRRLKGYAPHKFFGSWRLFAETGTDEEGNPIREEITSDQGFYATKDEAIAAARTYLAENPGAALAIEPRTVVFPSMHGGATLSDAAYSRLRRGLEAAATEEGITANSVEMLQGVARRRSRRRTFAAALKRTGKDGFAKDLDRVMRTHIGQTVRYVEMDKLKYAYVETTERMGLSAGRATSLRMEGKANLQEAIDAWFRDVNGNKQGMEEQLDIMLSKLGLAPSVLASMAPGVLVAMGGAPITGGLLAGFVGWNMYRAHKEGGAFISRTFSDRITSAMAHWKLGLGLNIGSAMVNLTQTFINTYPILGEKWTAVGVQRALAALYSQARNHDAPGRMSPDAHLLNRADIRTRFRYAEDTQWLSESPGVLKRLSMLPFESAERLNRAASFLGAYARAEDGGASPGEAMRQAEAVLTRTQFHQGGANKPEMLRQQWARIPLQFKNFMAQQIAFAFGLRGPGEIGRFLMMLFLIGGALAIPGFQLFDWLVELLFKAKASDMVAEQIADAQRFGDFAGGVMETVARGLPGLFGAAISERIGMGAGFLPDQGSDLSGPAIGTFTALHAMERNHAGLIDTLTAITPAAVPFKAMEAAANGASITSSAFWSGQNFGDGRAVWTNPRRRGQGEIEPTPGELAMRSAGLQPTRWANKSAVERAQLARRTEGKKDAAGYLADIIQANREGRSAEIGQIRAEAAREGVQLTPQRIREALRDAELTRAQRAVRAAPRQDRGDLQERMRLLDERAGVTPR